MILSITKSPWHTMAHRTEYHRRKRCPEGNTHLQLRLRNKFNGIWPIVMLLRKARKQFELYAIVIAFFFLQIDLQSFV